MYDINKKIIACTLALALSASAYATQPTQSRSPLFLILGTGASFSNTAHINPDPAFWDEANEGYNSSLGSTALYTAGIGYQFSPLISGDIEVTHRPSYHYSKYQTSAAPGTPGFLGDKTREFDLANTSIMANIILSGRGVNLFTHLNQNTLIQPFVGAGAGVSYNTVSNFHSVLPTQTNGYNDISSIMNSNTVAAFSWQFMLGVETLYKETWGLDIGYRYFDGGTFESNNYLTNTLSGFTTPNAAPAWKSRLTSNEVFVNLKYIVA